MQEHNSKQRSILTEYTVWCSPTFGSKTAPGHEGYAQSNEMDRKTDFIEAIIKHGWRWRKDDWFCPACAKAADQ